MTKRSDVRTANGLTVWATKMAGGSKRTIYSAWEPSALMGRHSTITTEDGQWLGQVGTRRIGPEIEALKGGSPERIAACEKFRAAQAREAQAAIIAAFPEAARGVPCVFGFEIEVSE